jgi:hypothetical protein
MSKADYDTDFYGWAQAQAEALRTKDWAALDVKHLAEEIESVGQQDRYAIESHLERLLLHLLKWRYDPATRPRRSWALTILDARGEIAKRATGSLQHHPAAYLPEAYRRARRKAAVAIYRPSTAFPEACPWTVAQVLDDEWLPTSADQE